MSENTLPNTLPEAAQKLSKKEFEEHLETEGLTIFKYNPNSRGFIFLQVCAVALFTLAASIYFATHFEPLYWGSISLFMTVGGLALLGLVTYWGRFASQARLAFNETHLYIIRPKQTYRINWRSILPENAGFGDPEESTVLGVLNMQIGEDEVILCLFNAYLFLEDYPEFLVEFLTQIKRNGDLIPPPKTETPGEKK